MWGAHQLQTMELIFKNLKDLEKFMIKSKYKNLERATTKIYNVIKGNAENLKYLAIDYEDTLSFGDDKNDEKIDVGVIEDYFKTNLPDLTFKMLNGYTENPWD
jgi:hypothetical protein